jgi:hypothetical protein
MGAAVMVANASVRESVTFTNVASDGYYGDPVNESRTFNSVGGYAVGRIDLTGQITQVTAGDYAGEGLIEAKHPNGRTRVIQMFNIGGYSGTLNGTASFYLSNSSNPAGTWTFKFFESYDDGGNGTVDKNWDSLQVDYTDELLNATPPFFCITNQAISK